MSQSPEPPDPTTPYGQQPPPPPSGPPVPTYGAPPSGSPSYGQPPHGQPTYGQPASWQTGQPAHGASGSAQQLSPSDRTWGCAAHWSAFVAAFVALAFLGPLIVMVTQGNSSAYVRRQAVEALNFQLSMFIYLVVSAFAILFLVGLVLLPILGLLWLVLTLVGTIKSANGTEYRYPLTIRMVG